MLSPEQIIIVGLVASALGVVVRLLSAKLGVEIGKFWMTIIVAVIALIMAVVFKLPELPEYIDPLQYVGAWVAIVSGYLGMATAIYNLVLDKVLDSLNLNVERFLG